ncbi:MAG TPA: hypothetical protein VLH39_07600 [Magnetospirillaceae bacterium]|nr:hypothetical protein [Magnetospirillaceae bacterium]
MIQFYFLSVLLNIVGGYALLVQGGGDKGTSFDGVRTFLRDMTVRLVLGVLTIVVGFFKLLTVMRGDIPIVGDFLPAVAGMATGFSLLLEFYRSNSNVTTETLERMDRILTSNRRIVGISSIVIGFVHFLFASVLFL